MIMIVTGVPAVLARCLIGVSKPSSVRVTVLHYF
jgi:hypothetical protein